MKKLFFCMFGWSLATSAYADLISVSETFSSPQPISGPAPEFKFDIAVGRYVSLNLANRGTIKDVNVFIDISASILEDSSYSLRHRKNPAQSWADPAVTRVILTDAKHFDPTPQDSSAIVRLLLDDSASIKQFGEIPFKSGSIAPIDPLTRFNGEDLFGEWGLFAFNDDDEDHRLHGWGLDITTEDVSPVPLPPSIVMLGIGLLGLGFSGRKKTD
ncbi:MAG: PEP-CTERM sorting domain-containing protein [Methylococcaceae bacterium]